MKHNYSEFRQTLQNRCKKAILVTPKNTRTGKTVRVNMEKLVKAVEKLTGEKFMIESMEAVE